MRGERRALLHLSACGAGGREQVVAGAVPERQIGGLVGCERERNADDLGLHRVGRTGREVEREAALLLRFRDPLFERRDVGDRRIGGAVELSCGRRRRARLRERLRRALCAWLARGRSTGGASSRGRRFAGRVRVGRARGGKSRIGVDRAGIDRIDLGRALRQRRELHRLEERDELLRIHFGESEICERHIDGHAAVQRHERLGDARALRMFDQRFAPFRLLDLVDARQQRFEIAEFVDELRGRLDTDARHARHIVGRVADQRLHVRHLLGRHAELLDHAGAVEPPLGTLAGLALDAGFEGICIRSLSDETISTSAPASAAWRA